MAFIEKKDPVVLNIRLTTKGRELLSTGNLSFKYFAIGDSEIDYEFDAAAGLNPFNANILRPTDNNPNIISFIPSVESGDTFNAISSIPASTYLVTNNAGSIGFFTNLTGNTFTFIVDGNHIKQPDAMIDMSGIAGGTTLSLLKAPAYGTSGAEPAIGDLLLVKWTVNVDTTGYTSQKSYPTPYLIYKISGKTGTLAANTLVVGVDRKIPDFTGMGATAKAGAMILYNYINFTGSTIFNQFSTDYLDESVLTFLQNSQCPTVIFPFWNMSIIFTDEIAGVQLGNKTYAEFYTKGYGGFVSYIQSQQPFYKKLGVIHYTNNSPANVYAEGFYWDGITPSPTLDVPTIMWHKSSTPKLGAKFIAASGNGYTLVDLGIHYYDLVDASNPTAIVGKIFDELKMFLIEDQELLYAMSYKSNRSWTLPQFALAGGTGGCPPAPPVQQTLFVQTQLGVPGSIKNTGGINIIGWENITEYGVEYKLTGATNWTRIKVGTTLTVNNFNHTITNTTPSKSYNYRAYVKIGNNEYIDHSNDNNPITTLPAPVPPPPTPQPIIPSVQTILGTGGIGQINGTGGNAIVGFTSIEQYWMEYRVHNFADWIIGTKLSGPLSVDNFTFGITGLINTVDTDYDYRAVIQVAGVAYPSGSYQTTTVLKQVAQTTYAPEVTTGIIFKQLSTNEGFINVLIKNNYVTSDGGAAITRYGILFTQDPAYYGETNLIYENVGASVKMSYLDGVPASFTLPFTMGIDGLLDSAPFYYRTFALNNLLGYGEILNGTTIPLVVVPTTKSIFICGVTETGSNPLVTSTISAKIGVSTPLGAGESVILHISNSALSDTITPPNEMVLINISACAYYTIGTSTIQNILANSTISFGTQDTCSCSNYGTITITSSNINNICLHANAYSAGKNGDFSYTNKAVVSITDIENVGGANYTLGANSYCADNSGTGGGTVGGGLFLPV